MFRRLWPSLFPKPIRKPLFDFPDVIIHASESAVKKHPLYVDASGFERLAWQPMFDGNVIEGQEYLIVDDFVGMGGTIANLKGYIESKGGIVIGATTLTGKPYSAKIAPDRNTLQELRDKHGKELEDWWQEKNAHTFDSLTQSEARYLLKTENADRVRNKIAEAEQEGDRRGSEKEV